MYQPRIPPADESGFRTWAIDETAAIARQLNGPFDGLIFKTLYAEPTRKTDGLVVRADGTTWNPGGGRGWYGWDATGATWVKLG